MSLILSPGPASYNIPSHAPTKPAVTMKGRYKAKDTSMTPSPQSYNIDVGALHKGPSFTIRPKTKIIQAADSVPAPGAYELTTHTIGHGRATTVTGRPSDKMEVYTDSPGPAAYQKPPMIGTGNAPSYTMNGRAKPDKNKENMPGVGTYNIPSSMAYDPHKAVKIQSRHDDVKLFDKQTPSPATYNIPSSIGGSNAPAATIKSRLYPKEFKTSVPAPGAYNIQPSIGTGRAATIKSRPKPQKSSTLDLGPGAYDLPSQNTTPSWSIRPRTGITPDNYCSPGPAAYNNLKPSTAPSITIAPKTIPVETTTQQTPSPAAYNIPSSIGGNNAPSASMRSRLYPKEFKTSVPAPGSYNIQNTIGTGRAATIKPRIKEVTTTIMESPGPGSYTIDMDAARRTQPKFSIGAKTGYTSTYACSTNTGFSKRFYQSEK